MLLLFEVEGIRDYLTIKVTSEADFDCASLGDVGRVKVGQESPFAVSRSRHVVRIFIDAGTTGLTSLWSRVLRQSFRLEDLGDIVVLDGAANLAPETD